VRCPHCGKDGKATVLESRPHDGCVWRRRACPKCHKTYVSQEQAIEGGKMPAETQSRNRLKDKKLKPEELGLKWNRRDP